MERESEMGRKETNLSQIVPTRSSSDRDFLRGVGIVFRVGEVNGEFLGERERVEVQTSVLRVGEEREGKRGREGNERGC